MEKTIKARAYPNIKQQHQIINNIGCCRFVYNQVLAKRKEVYEREGKTLSQYECVKLLPKLKKKFPFLKNVDSIALQASVEYMCLAYKNFFRGLKTGQKVGFPKFKSKRTARKAYTTKQNITVDGTHIYLPKIGAVRCVFSTPVVGRILRATVSFSKSGKCFVSIVCTDVDIAPLPKTGKTCGLDLGEESFAILDDGTKFKKDNYTKKQLHRLRVLQKSLSRKPKGSRNFEKTRKQIAVLSEKVANRRSDYLHKLSHSLITDYDTIFMESISPKEMVETKEDGTSKRVKRKKNLNIQDAAWGEFSRQMDYKASWYGKQVVHIDKYYPSTKTCSHCGYILEDKLDTKIRSWVCPSCSTTLDRDVNAAINIRREGENILKVS